MAHGFSLQGGLGAGGSVIPHDSSAHSVLVPDTELLFTAQFHRAGPDLVLTGRDGAHHLVPGYFSSEHHPALVAPNGAHLSPDTVDLLAGSAMPGHYAQAQPTAPPDSIGKIEKVVGDVTVVRNGVSVALHVGDAVFKSDVVATGSSSSCGISFPDGTALNLVANTRMALNDYAFDANSNSNGALFTLVEGTFAFVAGKVAHQGDMKIATPVATMGIRGTTGVVQEQPNAPATITATAADHTYGFAVVPDIGTGITGMWDVYLTDANGIIQRDANGNPIVLATVSQSGFVTYLTPQGPGERPLVSVQPATNSQYAFEQEMLSDLFRTLNPANLNNNNSNGGSSTQPPPFELPNPIPQLFEDNNKPFTIDVPNGANPTTPTIIDIVIGPTGPLTVVIWTASASGSWGTGPVWLGGALPTSPEEVEILNPVKVTTDGADSAAGLVVAAGATLNIVSGTSFTIYDFIQGGGTIQLNGTGSDPTLFVHGTVSLVGGGTIKMLGPAGEDNILGVPGTGALLLNIDYTIEGAGTIGGGDGNLTFENFGTVNANDGLLTINTGNQVYNDGLMEATVDPLVLPGTAGTLQIKDSVINAGTVQADGIGAAVTLSGATFDNLFSVVAKNGGSVTFTNVAVTNEAISSTDPAGGTINANGGTITFDGGSLANGNLLEATNGGTLQLENIVVTNSSAATATVDAASTLGLMGAAIRGGTIENDGHVVVTDGASVLHGDSVTNTGTMTIEAGASLTLEGDTTLINKGSAALINADGGTVAIELDTDTNVNSGTIKAVNGGEVDFYVNVDGGSNHGLIEAGAGGIVHFFDTHGGGGGGGPQGGNYGTMEATDGGLLIFDGGLDNFYRVEAVDGGTVDLNHGLKNHVGTVEAIGSGSVITVNGDVSNDAMIEATGIGAQVDLTNGNILNDATIEALNGGTITFDATLISVENTGVIEANAGGIVIIDGLSGGAEFANAGNNALGTIEAIGPDATVELSNATIFGGKLHSSGGGEFETINAGTTSTLINVIMTGGIFLMDADTILDLNGGANNGGNGVAAYIDSTVIFEGTGVVEMDSPSTMILGGVSNGTLQNETTIKGQGIIGSGDTALPGVLTLINSGLIEAVGGEFTINTGTRNAATTTNSGTLEANGANAVLLIHHTNMNDVGGTIAAVNSSDAAPGTASVVELLDDVIVGGTLKTSNFGTIETITNNGAATTTTFDGLANQGYVLVNDNTTLVLRNTINNTDGKIALALSGQSDLKIDGAVHLTSGVVELNTSGDNITALAAGATLTSSAIIQGQGQIGGGDGSLTLINAGGIVEAILAGKTLTIDTGNTVTNSGSLAALFGGTLKIEDSIINSNGILSEGLGSDVELSGATVTNNSGAAISAIENATMTLTGVAVTNSESIFTETGGQIFFNGGSLTNHNLVAASLGGKITFENGVCVTNDGGKIQALGNAIPGASITFDSSAGDVINKNGGIIDADQGTVAFGAMTVKNSGGTIEALESNGAVNLNGTTIEGGTLRTDSAGVIDALTGTSTFDGVTIAGGFIKAESGATVDLEDTTTLSGTVTLEGGGTFVLDAPPEAASIVAGATGGTLDIAAGATLTGSGDIGNDGATSLTLNNAGTIDADGHCASIDIDTGNTVTNTGLIEATNHGSLEIDDSVNNYGATPGTIKASSGGAIIFNGGAINGASAPSSGGTIEALSCGTIRFNGTTIYNQGSSIEADGVGAMIMLAGAMIIGGTLETSAHGIIETVACSGNTTFDGVTIATGSTIQVDDHTTLTLQDTVDDNPIITNNGTIALGQCDAGIIVNGDITLAGGGTVVLSGDTDSIVGAGKGATLHNANTIEGSGTIGGDDLVFINQACGIVDADVCGHTLALDTGHTVHNAGLLEATSGGTLEIDDNVCNTACGIISASGHDSVVQLNDVTITGGTVETSCGGLIQVVSGCNATIDCATIGCGTDVQVDSAATLTLSGVTDHGGSIDGTDASGCIVASTIDVTGDSTFCDVHLSGGDLTVESNVTLTLSGDKVSDVAVSGTDASGCIVASTIDVTGDSTFCDVSLTGGNLTVESAILTLDGGSTVDGGGAMTIKTGGTLDVDGGTTTIDLGGTITNHGTLEASCGGTLDIQSHVDNSCGALLATSGGVLDVQSCISGGTATIHGATLEFAESSNVNVTFCNGDSGHDYGTLILDDAAHFTGQIYGFNGTAAGSCNSDTVELTGFCETSYSVQCSGGNEILTLHDGDRCVTLTFDDFNQSFKFDVVGGNTYIYDPPAAGAAGATDAPAAATSAASNEHAVASAHQDGADHAAGPAKDAGFGGNQPSAVTSVNQNGSDATAATNDLAPAHGILALGTGQLAGAPGEAFGVNLDTAGHSGEVDAGVLTNGSNGGVAQSLLSSLLNVLTDNTSPIAVVADNAPVLDGEHLTDSTFVNGSGAANSEVTPAAPPTPPANEHIAAPALAASPAPAPAPSPTLASASFGGMGNDNFAFHPNLGSDTAQNADAHTSEIAHNNVQISGPALASTAPEFHQEFAFDAIHQDVANLAAAVDQFHQMASNATLLH
jgi:fibronectin-binding autotransporter adhesin